MRFGLEPARIERDIGTIGRGPADQDRPAATGVLQGGHGRRIGQHPLDDQRLAAVDESVGQPAQCLVVGSQKIGRLVQVVDARPKPAGESLARGVKPAEPERHIDRRDSGSPPAAVGRHRALPGSSWPRPIVRWGHTSWPKPARRGPVLPIPRDLPAWPTKTGRSGMPAIAAWRHAVGSRRSGETDGTNRVFARGKLKCGFGQGIDSSASGMDASCGLPAAVSSAR